MITTREIFVKLGKGRKQSSLVTTRDIDVSIKVDPSKFKKKTQMVSTNNLADVSDIGEKARRDKIMAERKALDLEIEKKKKEQESKLVEPSKELKAELKEVEKKLAIKDEKKLVIVGKEIIEPMETITHPVAKDIKVGKITTGEYKIEVEKKPWKDMTDEERKAAYKERAEKAKATREAKAKKKEEE